MYIFVYFYINTASRVSRGRRPPGRGGLGGGPQKLYTKIYKYIQIYKTYHFLRIFNISISYKTIVFPSPGAQTSAAHHRLTCRYWIRVRIIFIKITVF